MNILLDAVQYSNKSVMVSLLAKYGQLKMNQVNSDLLLACATSLNLIIYYMKNNVRLPNHERKKNWQKPKSKLIFDWSNATEKIWFMFKKKSTGQRKTWKLWFFFATFPIFWISVLHIFRWTAYRIGSLVLQVGTFKTKNVYIIHGFFFIIAFVLFSILNICIDWRKKCPIFLWHQTNQLFS